MSAADIRADVVPLQPTAIGSFTKANNVAGNLPALGPGLWVLYMRQDQNLNLGNIAVANGVTLYAHFGHSISFVATRTAPGYPATAGARTNLLSVLQHGGRGMSGGMMRVYYDSADGRVRYTLQGGGYPEGDWIEVAAADLGELTDWRVVKGELMRAVDLATAQDRARHEVNRIRGDHRLLYITALPGQQMVYLDKKAQARAWLADPAPDPADYPAIVAEIGSTAPTAHEVAQVYLNQTALWRQVSAVIEGVAMAAHAAIDTAASAETCETVAAGFEGQLRAALTAAGALP